MVDTPGSPDDIGKDYIDLLKPRSRGRRCVLVFDGYQPSPEDHEHKKWTKNSTGGVEVRIDPEKACPVSYQRKRSLVVKQTKKFSLLISAPWLTKSRLKQA